MRSLASSGSSSGHFQTVALAHCCVRGERQFIVINNSTVFGKWKSHTSCLDLRAISRAVRVSWLFFIFGSNKTFKISNYDHFVVTNCFLITLNVIW